MQGTYDISQVLADVEGIADDVYGSLSHYIESEYLCTYVALHMLSHSFSPRIHSTLQFSMLARVIHTAFALHALA